MGIFAMPLGWLLQLIYKVIGNYGISLVVLTLLVKLALFPVYAKSIKSSSRMGELQPKVKEIQQKYANDPAMMNQKVNELYKDEGVSMYGGCLPMVVQMFIIMGLFTLLRNPLAYLTNDEMIFAVHESFLWIKDLAQPDMWILPIGSAVATFLSQNMSSAAAAMGGNAQAQGMNQVMKFIFPVMILWMARSYPAGLAVYWFISQFVQIFYNLAFAKMKKNDDTKRVQAKKDKANEGKRRVERKSK